MLCDECRQNEAMGSGELKDFCGKCAKETKECRTCHEVKSIFEFEKNQRNPGGARGRRQDCKDCRKKHLKPLSAKARKAYEKENPPPSVGDTFQCPICERIFTVRKGLVNLDHDNRTGEARGYICGDCNTSMGRMGRDSVSALARGILWITNKGKINRDE